MTTIFGGEKGARLYRATVEEGKTYYFHAHIIDGIWGLEPIRADALGGKEFQRWEAGTKRLVNSKKSLAWAAENLPTATGRRAALDPAAIGDANTLRAEDGG